jgi:hypothetical protein
MKSMGLAETFALLRKHTTLADLLQSLEAKNTREPCLPDDVVSLSEERAKRQQMGQTSS